MKRFLLATVAAIAVTTSALAGGETFKRERYNNPGQGWAVDYIPATNTCTLSRMHTNDVFLQIVYMPKSDSFTLMLLNEKWTKITSGTEYKVRLHMDGGADRWFGEATGLWTTNGFPGLSVGGLKLKFLQSFMRRNRVDIYNAESGNWITALTLDGTSAGMTSLIGCLHAHESVKGSEPEPTKPAKPQGREFQS